MTNEKLEHANKLKKQINNLECACERLHNGHEIALCFYFDSNYGNSCYRHLLSLSEEQIKDVKEQVEKKIDELEKEFKAL